MIGMVSFGLMGCAATLDRGSSSVVGGLGKAYESRATSSDTPVLQMDVVVHCEDRPASSATQEFIGVLRDSLGWTQAVTAVATSPERTVEKAVGEDRAEHVATLTLDNPQEHDVPSVITAWGESIA